MAVFKCKMCGGDLTILPDNSVAECEYCGSLQTVPSADNEKKLALFARANRFRAACDFDKAAGIYESIVADFPDDPEAYWGLILCKYGIEYVDDPATGKKIPTCHRSSFDSVMDDSDFEQVMDNADPTARRVYREEAKFIEGLRKRILAVSSEEKPYDIFICYKETDFGGSRTIDSVMAQDIYDALTDKNYRVFFARITLEDKLGQEYEPYIFAALNSAKVMLVIGTDYEYFNAVWVKNEWSRYLKLMEKDKSKYLIPCYKGIDAYDMPKEFSRLQAQDLGKLGAIQDLIRGIGKLIPREAPTAAVVETVVPTLVNGINLSSLLKRGHMALEDRDWSAADGFFEQVLNADAENAEAHLGKLLCVMKASDRGVLEATPSILLSSDSPYANTANRIRRYATGSLAAWIESLEGLWEKQKQEERRRQEELRLEEQRKLEEQRLEEQRRLEEERRAKAEQLRLQAEARLEKQRREEAAKAQREAFRKLQGMIAAGEAHTVALKTDGTVLATGSNKQGQCNVGHFRDIVAVSAGKEHTVGLRSDGTVVATNYLGGKFCYFRQCEVSNWRGIVAISAGRFHTIGLKSDGTVVGVGLTTDHACDVSGWQNIVAISAGTYHTVGLKSDGTVVAVGVTKHGECNVSDWKNIVAICAGFECTLGLRADGTVVTAGEDKYFDKLKVSTWNNIVALCAGWYHTIGLTNDGILKATGDNGAGRREVTGWKDVVAICAGDAHTVGLKADGTLVATGKNKKGQCDVFNWDLFDNCKTPQARQEKIRQLTELRQFYIAR